MDWGSYMLGFGTAAVIAIAIPVSGAISDYKNERKTQRDNFRAGINVLENEMVDLVRAISGTQCHYDFLDGADRRSMLESATRRGEYWLSQKPEQLPRNLRPLLPEYQKVNREMMDVLNYLEKNDPRVCLKNI